MGRDLDEMIKRFTIDSVLLGAWARNSRFVFE